MRALHSGLGRWVGVTHLGAANWQNAALKAAILRPSVAPVAPLPHPSAYLLYLRVISKIPLAIRKRIPNCIRYQHSFSISPVLFRFAFQRNFSDNTLKYRLERVAFL